MTPEQQAVILAIVQRDNLHARWQCGCGMKHSLTIPGCPNCGYEREGSNGLHRGTGTLLGTDSGDGICRIHIPGDCSGHHETDGGDHDRDSSE